MDWNDVQEEKRALMREVVGSLGESEKKILVWLLQEEKLNRSKARWSYKKPLRDKLRGLVPER